MEKLKFPIIRESIPESKSLSMDDYLKFVEFHLKYTFDREAHDKWKKMLAVPVPFVLR
ncbi:MAG: hypothetical protein HY350_01645 [Candidatus Omnitrophica bacterium]|nr:hypothetical protein [Candidatus Omnitrophota bacterium]